MPLTAETQLIRHALFDIEPEQRDGAEPACSSYSSLRWFRSVARPSSADLKAPRDRASAPPSDFPEHEKARQRRAFLSQRGGLATCPDCLAGAGVPFAPSSSNFPCKEGILQRKRDNSAPTSKLDAAILAGFKLSSHTSRTPEQGISFVLQTSALRGERTLPSAVSHHSNVPALSQNPSARPSLR